MSPSLTDGGVTRGLFAPAVCWLTLLAGCSAANDTGTDAVVATVDTQLQEGLESCQSLIGSLPEPPVWVVGTVLEIDRVPGATNPRLLLDSLALEDGRAFWPREIRVPFACAHPAVEHSSGSLFPVSSLAVGSRVWLLVLPEFTIRGDGAAFRVRFAE